MELVVVPTRLELERLLALDSEAARTLRTGLDSGSDIELRICGFGAIGAAAFVARRLAAGGVDSVTLLGLAGSYDPADTLVGSAHAATAVQLAEAGAGFGDAFVDLSTLGFPVASVEDRSIFSQLVCPRDEPPAPPLASAEFPLTQVHLTVHAASGSTDQADERARRNPGAQVEEMEAFGIALACASAAVRFRSIRGVSNRAGDRNVAGWRIDEALRAASDEWLQGRSEAA